MNSQFLRAGVCLCLCLPITAVASAQGPPAYQPPSIRFEASGLTLFDAVKLTLQHDPAIKLQEADTEYRRGVLRSEKGLFDWGLGASGSYTRDQSAITDPETLAEFAGLGAAPADVRSEQGAVDLQILKLFRSGIQVRPHAGFSYEAQGYVDTDAERVYAGKLGFEIVLPLLRGAGRTSVAAAEIAAAYDVEASRLALLHQQSQSVYSTVQAYWEVRSLVDQVEVLRRSVEMEGQLGDITRALIAANEKPRSDESRVQAAVSDARSQYEAAQRQLVDARVALADRMGVALADALALPLASDAFPDAAAGLQIDSSTYSAFVKESAARRFDRQAALKTEASGKALLAGARIDTRPLLNLTADGWGTSSHLKTASFSKWVFKSGTVKAELEAPFGNNAARGLVEQRQATLNQASITSANLERQIGLNVIQFSESLRVAAERLRAAREAVRNYDQTILDEQARLKAGDSSLVDAILTEQQTTSARLSLVAAELEYATLIAALRYQSGLLVRDGAVDASQLTAVPAALLRR